MDFSNLQTPHWFLIGGGGLLLLAVILYFVVGRKGKVPGILLGVVAGGGLGFAGGMFALAHFGEGLWGDPYAGQVVSDEGPGPGPGGGDPAEGGEPGAGGARGGPRGAGGAGGGGRPGGAGGAGGGRGGPSAKAQLTTLVSKLNQLTAGTLKVELTPEQQQQVGKQLEGLTAAEELSGEEAKKRMDELLKSLEPNKDTLEAVGFRWTSGAETGGRGRPGEATANPFTEEDKKEELSTLQGRLGGAPKPPESTPEKKNDEEKEKDKD